MAYLRATLALRAYVKSHDVEVTDEIIVRWSRDNRVQSAILTREGDRFAASLSGECNDWEVMVVSSD